MRGDTRWWRKLRTKERLIIASLNNDNAFSLIIYIYIHAHTYPSLCSHATFNRAHSLHGLIPILFHPRNKPAFDSIRRRATSFPFLWKKGKPGLKIGEEGGGKKKHPSLFLFLVDSIIRSWSGELFDERRNSLESIIQPPPATALVTIVNGARPSTPLPL